MKTLNLNSTGPIVEFLQNILQKLGLYTGNIDGIFGNSTRNSVLQLQRNFGLTQDGIVGNSTWNALSPYIDGGLGFIVPTNIRYSSNILTININTLSRLYPFLNIGSAGRSVLNNNIPFISIGRGNKTVFYSASIHANEWITSIVLMKFLADYCYAYQNNLSIFGIPANTIYNNCTIYIIPMVNPDGVDLVTGEFVLNSPAYLFAQRISSNFPEIPFVDGWKSNIRGVDLENLQPFLLLILFK